MRQREWWKRLCNGETVPSPAGQYKDGLSKQHAVAAFHHMIERAKDQGYEVVRTPGPRGGETRATYHLREFRPFADSDPVYKMPESDTV